MKSQPHIPRVPRYYSIAETARMLKMTRAGVSNAYARGRIPPAAFVDGTPVFNDHSIWIWQLLKGRRLKGGNYEAAIVGSLITDQAVAK